ncbi:MAG: hypothetical protein U0942_15950 [Parvibaculum sp.]|uniref:hypothetical protein n=1 Tax=Parvibaculum sp. TaxID=2024848 RepID=UPI002ABBE7CD|nr:hypothetical protein [Parvibaculum sp.]MDZ4382825.1 hypothetical protein [Parvibaculum sp.]
MAARRVLSEELAEALTNLVGADLRLRAAAINSDKFEKRVAEFDRAAADVARRARAAGLVPEGI